MYLKSTKIQWQKCMWAGLIQCWEVAYVMTWVSEASNHLSLPSSPQQAVQRTSTKSRTQWEASLILRCTRYSEVQCCAYCEESYQDWGIPNQKFTLVQQREIFAEPDLCTATYHFSCWNVPSCTVWYSWPSCSLSQAGGYLFTK